MEASEREKNTYGSDVEVVSREEECTVYRLSDGTGEIFMTSYKIFPGIEFIYNDVHIEKCEIHRAKSGNIFEINHCREGRLECGFQDEFTYLTPGDMTIANKVDVQRIYFYPLNHYHGITIMIDMDNAPRCLSCILADVNVRPSALIRKFCGKGRCFVTRSNPSVERIFSELYSVPKKIRRGYLKIKVLELMLFLNGTDLVEEEKECPRYSQAQVEIANKVCKYLTEHMDDKITLAQLSEFVHISGTQIKNSFKGVYGVSFYSYIRKQKMQAAGLMLHHSDSTILEVAGRFGYDNGSKFAAAFKAVMGMTPSKYRSAVEPSIQKMIRASDENE